jgi:type VI secretion system protein VasJ
MTAGNFNQALSYSEEQLRLYIFFLDLQKASFDALKSLGFDDSSKVLLMEAVLFTTRFPLLLTLTFNDGTPLANEETKGWLKSATMGQSQVAGAVSVEEKIATAVSGDPAQRLSKLSQAENRPKDGRSLFVSRLAEIKLWQRLGQKTKAVGLADHLITLLKRYDLEYWEPDLGILALKTAYDVYHSSGPAFADQAKNIAVQLALLSPEEALTLAPLDLDS